MLRTNRRMATAVHWLPLAGMLLAVPVLDALPAPSLSPTTPPATASPAAPANPATPASPVTPAAPTNPGTPAAPASPATPAPGGTSGGTGGGSNELTSDEQKQLKDLTAAVAQALGDDKLASDIAAAQRDRDQGKQILEAMPPASVSGEIDANAVEVLARAGRVLRQVDFALNGTGLDARLGKFANQKRDNPADDNKPIEDKLATADATADKKGLDDFLTAHKDSLDGSKDDTIKKLYADAKQQNQTAKDRLASVKKLRDEVQATLASSGSDPSPLAKAVGHVPAYAQSLAAGLKGRLDDTELANLHASDRDAVRSALVQQLRPLYNTELLHVRLKAAWSAAKGSLGGADAPVLGLKARVTAAGGAVTALDDDANALVPKFADWFKGQGGFLVRKIRRVQDLNLRASRELAGAKPAAPASNSLATTGNADAATRKLPAKGGNAAAAKAGNTAATANKRPAGKGDTAAPNSKPPAGASNPAASGSQSPAIGGTDAAPGNTAPAGGNTAGATDSTLPEKLGKPEKEDRAEKLTDQDGAVPSSPATLAQARAIVTDFQTITNDWEPLFALWQQNLKGKDKQGNRLATELKDADRNLAALDLYRELLAGVAAMLEETVGGDRTNWVEDQVRLFYFTDVRRLMRALNPTTALVNPSSLQAKSRAETARENLDQNDAALATQLAKVNDLTSRVTGIEEEIRVMRARSEAATSHAATAATLLNGLQAQKTNLTDQQGKTTDTKESTRLGNQIKLLEGNISDQQKVKDEADNAKSQAEEERKRLDDEQSALPARLREARDELSNARTANTVLRQNALSLARADVAAFVAARDDAQILLAEPSAGSTDPARRVLLFAYPDSKTIFIRGSARDLELVRDIIGGYDRPAPQARITLYTLQMNGTRSEKLNDAMKDVDTRLRDLRGEVNLVQDILRDSINREVNRASLIAERAGVMADGDASVAATPTGLSTALYQRLRSALPQKQTPDGQGLKGAPAAGNKADRHRSPQEQPSYAALRDCPPCAPCLPSCPPGTVRYGGRLSRYFYYSREFRQTLGFNYELPPLAADAAELQYELELTRRYYSAAKANQVNIVEFDHNKKARKRKPQLAEERDDDLAGAAAHLDRAWGAFRRFALDAAAQPEAKQFADHFAGHFEVYLAEADRLVETFRRYVPHTDSHEAEVEFTRNLHVCSGNPRTYGLNIIERALDLDLVVAQQLLEYQSRKASGPARGWQCFPTEGQLADIDYVSRWTLPDPANTTTLGEMLFVLSLGNRQSRERILNDFQTELSRQISNLGRAGSSSQGEAAPRSYSNEPEAGPKPKPDTTARNLKEFRDALLNQFSSPPFGAYVPQTQPGDEIYPLLPRVLLGGLQSQVPEEEGSEGMTANQKEIMTAVHTKVREAVASEIRRILRQIDELEDTPDSGLQVTAAHPLTPANRRYNSTSAELLRRQYLPLVGWLHEAFYDERHLQPGDTWAQMGQAVVESAPCPPPFKPAPTVKQRTAAELEQRDAACRQQLIAADQTAWDVAHLVWTRNALSQATARVAAADDMIKRMIIVAESDLDHFFVQPAMEQLRDDVTNDGVQLGTIQEESILATNRLVARVDPSANADLLISNGTDFLNEAEQLAQLTQRFHDEQAAAKLSKNLPLASGGLSAMLGASPLTAVGVLGITSLLGDMAAKPQDPPGELYSINSGNLFQVTPIFDPSGQALRFQFDFTALTRVQEPNGTTNRAIPRVERHTVNTEVQLTNLELREISRFGNNARIGVPTVKTGGIPLVRDLPIIRDIPLLGYYTRKGGSDATQQESLIFAQTSVYPTVGDIVELLTDTPPHLDLERRPPGYLKRPVNSETAGRAVSPTAGAVSPSRGMGGQ